MTARALAAVALLAASCGREPAREQAQRQSPAPEQPARQETLPRPAAAPPPGPAHAQEALSTGADTPEVAVATLLEAFATGDAAKLEAALPAEDRLRAALRCRQGKGPFEALGQLRNRLAGELPRTRGLGFALISLETLDSRIMAPGAEAAGCEPLEPVEMRIVELQLDVTDRGKVDHQREQSVVVALADRWYVLDY